MSKFDYSTNESSQDVAHICEVYDGDGLQFDIHVGPALDGDRRVQLNQWIASL